MSLRSGGDGPRPGDIALPAVTPRTGATTVPAGFHGASNPGGVRPFSGQARVRLSLHPSDCVGGPPHDGARCPRSRRVWGSVRYNTKVTKRALYPLRLYTRTSTATRVRTVLRSPHKSGADSTTEFAVTRNSGGGKVTELYACELARTTRNSGSGQQPGAVRSPAALQSCANWRLLSLANSYVE